MPSYQELLTNTIKNYLEKYPGFSPPDYHLRKHPDLVYLSISEDTPVSVAIRKFIKMINDTLHYAYRLLKAISPVEHIKKGPSYKNIFSRKESEDTTIEKEMKEVIHALNDKLKNISPASNIENYHHYLVFARLDVKSRFPSTDVLPPETDDKLEFPTDLITHHITLQFIGSFRWGEHHLSENDLKIAVHAQMNFIPRKNILYIHIESPEVEYR